MISNKELPENKIECSDCPYGHFGECGWARCPTEEEWEVIKAYFKGEDKK